MMHVHYTIIESHYGYDHEYDHGYVMDNQGRFKIGMPPRADTHTVSIRVCESDSCHLSSPDVLIAGVDHFRQMETYKQSAKLIAEDMEKLAWDRGFAAGYEEGIDDQ